MIGTRGNKHKLQEGKLWLDIRKKNQLEINQIGQKGPRDILEHPSLEMLKTQLAKALSRLEEARWDQMTSRGPFQPKNTLF